MKYTKGKTTIPILIIVVVVAGLLAGGSWWYVQQQSSILVANVNGSVRCEQITDAKTCYGRDDCLAIDKCSCITQGERGRKCSTNSGIVCDCVIGGFERCEILQCPATNASSTAIELATTITGCASPAANLTRMKGAVTSGPNDIQPSDPSVIVDGTSVTYSRAIRHACCVSIIVSKEVIGNTINLYEEWGGSICKCMCASSVSATVSSLPLGAYMVNVYERGATSERGDTPTLVIAKNVTIQ